MVNDHTSTLTVAGGTGAAILSGVGGLTGSSSVAMVMTNDGCRIGIGFGLFVHTGVAALMEAFGIFAEQSVLGFRTT